MLSNIREILSGRGKEESLFSSLFNHGCNRECKMTDLGWLS